MIKKCVLMCTLVLAWGLTAVCQSTTVAIKIGNNGNISLTNKYKSGNYTEIYNFGNGYQAGIEVYQPLAKFLGIKAEAMFVNTYFEMDHNSQWPKEGKSRNSSFYEEIAVNNTSFNFSGSAILKLGRIKLGVGPEVAMGFQSNGRGARFHYDQNSYDGQPELVQYKFHSKRKQVYNLNNEDEMHTYDVNRIIWGLNLNANVLVFRSFSIELKTFYAMTDFIAGFKSLQNEAINQETINAQISVKYAFPLRLNSAYNPRPQLKKRPRK